jgi:membrane associated rhomboid family serine protease
MNFKKSTKAMLKDKKFLSLAVAFGIVNGIFNIYGSLMDDILGCYGFSTDDVSTLGAILICSGIISAAIFGVYV